MSYLTDERISAAQTIAGYRVLEMPSLRYDQVIYSESFRIIMCGEINHFRWLVWRIAFRAACRDDVRRAFAPLRAQVGLE